MRYHCLSGARPLRAALFAAPICMSTLFTVEQAAGATYPAAPIEECGPTTNVSPSTFSATLNKTSGCAVLVLSAGTYPRLTISQRSVGVLTIRCAQPGRCTMGTGGSISSTNGLILDGVSITGGSQGIAIGASKNILIKRSLFSRQTNTGVLVTRASSENIQFQNNTFFNDRVARYLSDGSPDGEMDYGIRAYEAKNLDIRGNVFEGKFNHAIASRTGIDYMEIDDNTFLDCGRNCIELGQDPTKTGTGDKSCGEAVVVGNTFKDVKGNAVFVKNIRKVIVTGNTFDNVTGRTVHVYTFTGRENTPGEGALVNGGVPANRQVVVSGNVVN